jgi:hypothetical protein
MKILKITLLVVLLITFTYLVVIKIDPLLKYKYLPKSQSTLQSEYIIYALSQVRQSYSSVISDNVVDYSTICSNSNIMNYVQKADDLSLSKSKCFSDKDSWVIATKMKKSEKGFQYLCIDSTNKLSFLTSTNYDLITTANTPCNQ